MKHTEELPKSKGSEHQPTEIRSGNRNHRAMEIYPKGSQKRKPSDFYIQARPWFINFAEPHAYWK